MNMDTYTFRFKVEKYTKEVIKDLEEVKKIGNLNKQLDKISFDLRIQQRYLEELKEDKPKDYMDNYYP